MEKGLLFSALVLSFGLSFAQTTVTFKPNAAVGKDAPIMRFDNNCVATPDSITTAYMNYGSEETLWMKDWTWYAVGCSGGTFRSLICFTELNNIPDNAVILNATLRLYGTDADRNTSFPGAPSSYHDNTVIVQQVTSAWDENTVTWNTQPTTTTANQFTISPSTSEYNWDCTISNPNLVAMVQNMVSGNNYGFMLRLQTEVHYRNMVFSSSDSPDSTLWPELEVTYVVCNAHFSYCVANTGTNPLQYTFTSLEQGGTHIWKLGNTIVANTPNFTYPIPNGLYDGLCHTVMTQYDTCEYCMKLCSAYAKNASEEENNQDASKEQSVSVPQGKVDLGDEVGLVDEKDALKVVPNPTNGKYSVHFFSLDDDFASITMYDGKGGVVFSQDVAIERGENIVSVDCTNCVNGIYTLAIKGGQINLSQRVSVIK